MVTTASKFSNRDKKLANINKSLALDKHLISFNSGPPAQGVGGMIATRGGEDSLIPGYDPCDEHTIQVFLESENADTSEDDSFSGADQTIQAPERVKTWPVVAPQLCSEKFATVYSQVQVLGLPNEKGARIPLQTKLNIKLWEDSATGHIDDEKVLNGIRFGFSLQYVGPPLSEVEIEMHESGKKYESHIREYLETEKSLGAMAGPFTQPPFNLWCRTSPIMTRPKADSHSRRIIIDLSYPPEENINRWVIKGNYYGQRITHRLPRIEDVVDRVAALGFQVALATIDIKRAYRNFPGCPLDYPLNTIRFRNQYFIDLAMPFGARTSSLYMQKSADLITRALQKHGILSHIYLDDVILYFRPNQDAQARMREVIDFMIALGLPLAEEKIQFPTHKVKYLGIWLDSVTRLLFMPEEKIRKFLDLVKWVETQQRVSKKVVQTLVGKTIHIVACVPAARTFINRILMNLRASHNETMVSIDPGFLSDLTWFKRFLKKFNGRSMMKTSQPMYTIEADACLQGGGATDYSSYIAYLFPEKCSRFHISILEALNCLVACRALLTKEKHSSVVLIKCDNIATIECFNRGTARDPFMAAISRAMWYVLARADITPIYRHTPGEQMTAADALSRMHFSHSHRDIATNLIQQEELKEITMKPHYLDFSDFL